MGESPFDAVGRVMLFPMAQFMAEDKGQFIFIIVQGGEQADIDGYIVSQGTVGVEFGAVVDEIMIGILFDGGVRLGNGCGKSSHDPFQHGIGFRIFIDTLLSLDLFQVFSPALAVQVGHLFVQHAVLGGNQDHGADGIAPVKGFCCWQGCRRQGKCTGEQES